MSESSTAVAETLIQQLESGWMLLPSGVRLRLGQAIAGAITDAQKAVIYEERVRRINELNDLLEGPAARVEDDPVELDFDRIEPSPLAQVVSRYWFDPKTNELRSEHRSFD